MKVNKLKYNYRQVGSVIDRDGAGEDFDWFEVGQKEVKSITENYPIDGMPLNYLIELDNGNFVRVFNPNYVEYSK